ncbi:hypothetical protein, partial [Clostridium perfringens]|uniref:hypothetical protein n=1 Tax=Clostridium perfringens TaxID=1502 RepID=UPI00321AF42F
GYINSFVDDFNSGRANLVNDEPLYREQVKDIPEISKQFKERVDSIDVKILSKLLIINIPYKLQKTEL